MTPPSDPRLAVIIVNYNTREWLARCLRSLERQSIRDEIEIIVVDNASSDGSIDEVRDEFPGCNLVSLDENIGLGAANNVGARLATAPTLLILNPDTELPPGALEEFLQVFERSCEVAIAGGTIHDGDGELERSTGSFPTLVSLVLDRLLAALPALRGLLGRYSARHWSGYDVERAVDWVTAASMWFRRDAFEALGGFDEAIFMYYEDVDLCFRARRQGLGRCRYIPGTAITHFRNKAPTPHDRKQLQRRWLRHFGRKHYRWPRYMLTRLLFGGLARFSRARR